MRFKKFTVIIIAFCLFKLSYLQETTSKKSNGTSFLNTSPKFIPLKVGEVKPTGWMKAQIKHDWEEGYIGVFPKLSPNFVGTDIFNEKRVTLKDIKSRPDTAHGGIWWPGEHEGYWADAMIRAAFLTEDSCLIKKTENYVNRILNYQSEQGYIGIYGPKVRYQHSGENGELWTQSRILVALLAYYEMTGKEKVLQSVKDAVDLTISKYGPKNSYFQPEHNGAGVSHGLAYIDVLEWLYRITEHHKYVDFAEFLYQDYSKSNTVRVPDIQLSKLQDKQLRYNGHGVHIVELIRVPLWIYFATGNQYYSMPSINAYEKVFRHLLPSGALVSDEWVRKRKPSPNLSTEYCTITELLISSESAFQKTGDVVFADLAENLLFNAAQGARLANGKGISYFTADNRLKTGKERKGREYFSPLFHANCCALNAERILPYYIERMWLRSSNGLVASMYGPCKLETSVDSIPVKITSKTTYPFSERIEFTVDPEANLKFPIRFRKPEWSDNTIIKSQDSDIHEKDGYYIVNKEWQSGDRIEIRFNFQVHLHQAVNSEYYVKWGPVLFALPLSSEQKILENYSIRDLKKYAYLPTQESIKMWRYRFCIKDEHTGSFRFFPTIHYNFCANNVSKQFFVIINSKAELKHPRNEQMVKMRAPMMDTNERKI